MNNLRFNANDCDAERFEISPELENEVRSFIKENNIMFSIHDSKEVDLRLDFFNCKIEGNKLYIPYNIYGSENEEYCENDIIILSVDLN